MESDSRNEFSQFDVQTSSHHEEVKDGSLEEELLSNEEKDLIEPNYDDEIDPLLRSFNPLADPILAMEESQFQV